MKFTNAVYDIIRVRKSKRTYIEEPLPADITAKIENIIQTIKTGPFGNIVNFHLIEKRFAKENHKVKLGTYGFISGAQYFIAGEVRQADYCYEDYGYLLEKIILHLTELNLGTCWLGGTFKRSDFTEILNTDNDSHIPGITPVGYTTDTYSFRENLIRWGAKADSRKDWKTLFYKDSFSTPLDPEEALTYRDVLEMVRLAPSASNKQPWRIIKQGNSFHFYLQRTPGYGKMIKSTDLQKMDMGIAMCHFELCCQADNLSGKWNSRNPGLCTPEVAEYIVSWEI
jgi:nitroreductase